MALQLMVGRSCSSRNLTPPAISRAFLRYSSSWGLNIHHRKDTRAIAVPLSYGLPSKVRRSFLLLYLNISLPFFSLFIILTLKLYCISFYSSFEVITWSIEVFIIGTSQIFSHFFFNMVEKIFFVGIHLLFQFEILINHCMKTLICLMIN